jgi:hypothetical protein
LISPLCDRRHYAYISLLPDLLAGEKEPAPGPFWTVPAC